MENNKAHRFIEGNYNLIVKGNEVVLVNNVTGDATNARCHPDDNFYISVGVDKVFKRMFEKKMKMRFNEMKDCSDIVEWLKEEEDE